MTNKKRFLRFMFTGLGSAVVVSIYSIVDAICIGNYVGEIGSAVVASVMPMWSIVFSLGLLFGMGAGTYITLEKAKNNNDSKNEYFTTAFLTITLISILIDLIFIIFRPNVLSFFGAKNESVLESALVYTFPIMFFLPLFPLISTLSGVIRNDNDPLIPTISTIAGGVFNVVGDILFVFVFNMGIVGAGLATGIGYFLSFVILLIHFFKKSNTLRLAKIKTYFPKLKNIIVAGFSAFVADICIAIVVIVFNSQINKYTNNDATTLAVYGIICNMVALLQSFAYSVGQANQPLLSESYAKEDRKSLYEFHVLGLITSLAIGLLFFLVFMIIPKQMIQIFIDTKNNDTILQIGPSFIRKYFIMAPILVINVYSLYYFQSILKEKEALIISFLRGLILPILLLIIVPIFNFNLIWYVMIIVESATFLVNLSFQLKRKRLLEQSN